MAAPPTKTNIALATAFWSVVAVGGLAWFWIERRPEAPEAVASTVVEGLASDAPAMVRSWLDLPKIGPANAPGESDEQREARWIAATLDAAHSQLRVSRITESSAALRQWSDLFHATSEAKRLVEGGRHAEVVRKYGPLCRAIHAEASRLLERAGGAPIQTVDGR